MTLSTGGAAWSKQACINSISRFTRYLTHDPNTGWLYLASDYAMSYSFICKMRTADGVASYCIKLQGGGYDLVLQLKVFGDFLMVHGSSASVLFTNDPTQSIWGNYVLWLPKDLQSGICNPAAIVAENSLTWNDVPLPMKAIILTDVLIEDSANLAASTSTVANPSMELLSLCDSVIAPDSTPFSV